MDNIIAKPYSANLQLKSVKVLNDKNFTCKTGDYLEFTFTIMQDGELKDLTNCKAKFVSAISIQGQETVIVEQNDSDGNIIIDVDKSTIKIYPKSQFTAKECSSLNEIIIYDSNEVIITNSFIFRVVKSINGDIMDKIENDIISIADLENKLREYDIKFKEILDLVSSIGGGENGVDLTDVIRRLISLELTSTNHKNIIAQLDLDVKNLKLLQNGWDEVHQTRVGYNGVQHNTAQERLNEDFNSLDNRVEALEKDKSDPNVNIDWTEIENARKGLNDFIHRDLDRRITSDLLSVAAKAASDTKVVSDNLKDNYYNKSAIDGEINPIKVDMTGNQQSIAAVRGDLDQLLQTHLPSITLDLTEVKNSRVDIKGVTRASLVERLSADYSYVQNMIDVVEMEIQDARHDYQGNVHTSLKDKMDADIDMVLVYQDDILAHVQAEDAVLDERINTLDGEKEVIRNNFNDLLTHLSSSKADVEDERKVSSLVFLVQRQSGSTRFDINIGKFYFEKYDGTFVQQSDVEYAKALTHNVSGNAAIRKDMKHCVNSDSYENVYSGVNPDPNGTYVIFKFNKEIDLKTANFYIKHYYGDSMNCDVLMYTCDNLNTTLTDTALINDLKAKAVPLAGYNNTLPINVNINMDKTIIIPEDNTVTWMWDEIKTARGTYGSLGKRIDVIQTKVNNTYDKPEVDELIKDLADDGLELKQEINDAKGNFDTLKDALEDIKNNIDLTPVTKRLDTVEHKIVDHETRITELETNGGGSDENTSISQVIAANEWIKNTGDKYFKYTMNNPLQTKNVVHSAINSMGNVILLAVNITDDTIILETDVAEDIIFTLIGKVGTGISVDLTPFTGRLGNVETEISDAKGIYSTLKAKIDSISGGSGGNVDLTPIENRLTFLEDGLMQEIGDGDPFTGKALILFAEYMSGTGIGDTQFEVNDITILKSNGRKVTEDEVELVNGYAFGVDGEGNTLFHRGFSGQNDLLAGNDTWYSMSEYGDEHNDAPNIFNQIMGYMVVIKFKEEQTISKVSTMMYSQTDKSSEWGVMLFGAADWNASYDSDTGVSTPADNYFSDYIDDLNSALGLGGHPDNCLDSEDVAIDILFGNLKGYALWDEIGEARQGHNTLGDLTASHEARIENIENNLGGVDNSAIEQAISPIRNDVSMLKTGLMEFVQNPNATAVRSLIINVEEVVGHTSWDIYFGKIYIKKDDNSFVTSSECSHAFAYGYNPSGDVSRYKDMIGTINTNNYENLYGNPQGVNGHYIIIMFNEAINVKEVQFYVKNYHGTPTTVKLGTYTYDSFDYTQVTPPEVTANIHDMIANKTQYGGVIENQNIGNGVTVTVTDFDGAYLTTWDEVRTARGTYETLVARLDALEAENISLKLRIATLENA